LIIIRSYKEQNDVPVKLFFSSTGFKKKKITPPNSSFVPFKAKYIIVHFPLNICVRIHSTQRMLLYWNKRKVF